MPHHTDPVGYVVEAHRDEGVLSRWLHDSFARCCSDVGAGVLSFIQRVLEMFLIYILCEELVY